MQGLFAEGLTHWQSWLLLALVLGIAEIVMPGIFLIWVAMAAGVTGILTLLLPLSVAAQLVLFAVLCIAAFYAGRRWYVGANGPSEDPLLNDRTARLTGEVVALCAAMENGRGRVKVGDSEWQCRMEGESRTEGESGDLPVGTRVRITGAHGAVLVVEQV